MVFIELAWVSLLQLTHSRRCRPLPSPQLPPPPLTRRTAGQSMRSPKNETDTRSRGILEHDHLGDTNEANDHTAIPPSSLFHLTWFLVDAIGPDPVEPSGRKMRRLESDFRLFVFLFLSSLVWAFGADRFILFLLSSRPIPDLMFPPFLFLHSVKCTAVKQSERKHERKIPIQKETNRSVCMFRAVLPYYLSFLLALMHLSCFHFLNSSC